jgi:hypothetical protein
LPKPGEARGVRTGSVVRLSEAGMGVVRADNVPRRGVRAGGVGATTRPRLVVVRDLEPRLLVRSRERLRLRATTRG